LGTYVGLGRMVEFAALARDAVVESSSFSFRGRVVEVHRFVADLGAYGLKISDGATVDVGIPGYGMEVISLPPPRETVLPCTISSALVCTL